MEWNDEGLDDEPPSPLLPPDDRLWRHPSEVVGGAPTNRRTSAPSGPPRLVTVVALTSCISMLLTLGVVAVVRPFRDPDRAGAITDRTPTGGLDTVADVAEVTTRLRPAIAQIHARQPGGGEEWGSGVIFQSDGMMLTAHHLVDGAEQLSVSLDDGRKMSARVIGADTDTDIAVLDLEGRDFPVAPLADSRASLKVGQPAITIGTSRGASPSGPLVRVTVVSAMGQEAAVDGRKFVDMIRTDAAMEPGCTGGAVVDRNGNVIGIAAANVPTTDGMSGYATPIDVARSVASQIISDGKVQRGWLGIDGSSGSGGVVVGNVLPNSPAAAAGLAPGEVITAISDRTVSSMTALVAQLRKLKPGSMTTLVVERSGEKRTVAVTLGERPA